MGSLTPSLHILQVEVQEVAALAKTSLVLDELIDETLMPPDCGLVLLSLLLQPLLQLATQLLLGALRRPLLLVQGLLQDRDGSLLLLE